MWYFHQVFSGTFIVGVLGNIVAAILGFIVGLAVAHRVYDLRKIHAAILRHTNGLDALRRDNNSSDNHRSDTTAAAGHGIPSNDQMGKS